MSVLTYPRRVRPAADKKRRLEAKGWRVGSTKDFLGLTPEEAAFIEIRLRLADALREHRARREVTQLALAKMVKSSQSRIAKMEAGDATVSIDLLVRTLLALGVTPRELGRAITTGALARAANGSARRARTAANRVAARPSARTARTAATA